MVVLGGGSLLMSEVPLYNPARKGAGRVGGEPPFRTGLRAFWPLGSGGVVPATQRATRGFCE